MSDADTANPPQWDQRLRPLAAELSRMVDLRRRLAALEIAHDKRLITRSVIGGGAGVLAAIIGVTLLLQAVASSLATDTISATAWTVILGAVLFAPGILLLAHAIHKVRSRFCGLQGTLAEINEDLIWLREWTQAADDRDR